MDLTNGSRKIQYFAFKTFYIEERLKTLKGKDYSKFKLVAQELNITRSTIYNNLKKIDDLKTNALTKFLYTAYTQKSPAYLEIYKNEVAKQRITKIVADVNKLAVERKAVVLTKFDKNKALMTNLKLAEYLRLNNVLKHDCWDIKVTDISENQWNGLRKINPKMFDSYVK